MSKVVFITGAAKRIGATIARTFHRQGFKVIIHYHRSADEANTLIEELNGNQADSAAALQADLTDRDATLDMAKKVVNIFGRLDVLVNNASSFYPTRLGEIEQQTWDDLIDSNLRGAFFISQQLADELKSRKGAIVNIVDTHSDRPLQGFSAYSIAKAGLKAMTKSLAIELAPDVRVNGVSPGAILWPPSLENDQDPDVLEKRAVTLARIPLARLGKTKDIAEAVFYLAIEANYITGFTLKVDGGRSLI
ncbi:MAG: pteridine reductase [Pseudohongiellaceae bacterium]